MKRMMHWNVGLASMVVAACVTINVYFPTAAAEAAADKVISEVTSGSNAVSPPQTRTPNDRALWQKLAQRLIDQTFPVAHAQANANIEVSSPEIRAITASMKARFAQLEPYFANGVVGLTNSGRVELRDQSAVPIAERALVRRLLAEDNMDRDTLYLEIARANGHPEWEADIRQTFARRWVDSPSGAKAGWYYQDASGSWVQKR